MTMNTKVRYKSWPPHFQRLHVLKCISSKGSSRATRSAKRITLHEFPHKSGNRFGPTTPPFQAYRAETEGQDMTARLYDWARDLRNRVRYTVSKQKSEPSLPYLPFQVALSLDTDGESSATTSCAFFTRLPPEIRRKILISAFGCRTLHMHLRFETPLLPRSKDRLCHLRYHRFLMVV